MVVQRVKRMVLGVAVAVARFIGRLTDNAVAELASSSGTRQPVVTTTPSMRTAGASVAIVRFTALPMPTMRCSRS